MKILLVDDHPLFLDGIEKLLTLQGLEVVGTACDGMDALKKARTLKPEVILMDIQMPRLDGLMATRLIKAEQPDIKIVMLSMSDNDQYLFEAIKSGACGYLLKADKTEKFLELFLGLIHGETPLSPGLASRILAEFAIQGKIEAGAPCQPAESGEYLTPRQIEVLSLVSEGLTYKEVGAKLFLAEQTIKYHMGEIIKRLHMENRRQAIEYARLMGLTEKSFSQN
jgi:DNA-binding NarL/FixJ family response regulator